MDCCRLFAVCILGGASCVVGFMQGAVEGRSVSSVWIVTVQNVLKSCWRFQPQTAAVREMTALDRCFLCQRVGRGSAQCKPLPSQLELFTETTAKCKEHTVRKQNLR